MLSHSTFHTQLISLIFFNFNNNHIPSATFHYIDLVSQSVSHFSVSPTPSMANYYSLGLVAAMDRLWFHQIILFSEPIISGQKNPQTTKPNSVSLAYSPLPDEEISSAISLLPDEEISSDSSPISPTVLKPYTS